MDMSKALLGKKEIVREGDLGGISEETGSLDFLKKNIIRVHILLSEVGNGNFL